MPEVEQQEAQRIQLKQQGLTLVEQAAAIVIKDQLSYNEAARLLLQVIVPFRKKWHSYWHGSDDAPGPIKLAYKSYKSLQEKFNEVDEPAEVAEKAVKRAIVAWDAAEQKRQEELQRLAQKDAEDEEEERRLAASIIAENNGATEEQIRQIVSAPSCAIAAPVAPTYRPAAGVSKPRDNWSAEVTDFKALVKAVASGKAPLEYLLPNQPRLNERAKADRLTMNIAGVKARNNPNISARVK